MGCVGVELFRVVQECFSGVCWIIGGWFVGGVFGVGNKDVFDGVIVWVVDFDGVGVGGFQLVVVVFVVQFEYVLG